MNHYTRINITKARSFFSSRAHVSLSLCIYIFAPTLPNPSHPQPATAPLKTTTRQSRTSDATLNHLLLSCFGILGLRDHQHLFVCLFGNTYFLAFLISTYRGSDDDDCVNHSRYSWQVPLFKQRHYSWGKLKERIGQEL